MIILGPLIALCCFVRAWFVWIKYKNLIHDLRLEDCFERPMWRNYYKPTIIAWCTIGTAVLFFHNLFSILFP